MTDDRLDDLIRQRRDELIHATEDAALQRRILREAYSLNHNSKMDAEDCSQEAITRFISVVKSKTALGELGDLERMQPFPYIRQIMRNLCADQWKKTHRTVSPEITARQIDHSQEGESDRLGRQKHELLAAQLQIPVETIIERQAEESQGRSANGEGEEYVVSKIIVEMFINSLPEELRRLTRLLVFGGYQFKELAKEMSLTTKKANQLRRQVRKELRRFLQEQIQLEEARSNHGR